MRETKSPLTIQLTDDKTEAKIRTTMLPMSAKDVEDAIGVLAMARAQMQPPIPTEYPQDHAAHRHQGTHYYVAWDFLAGTPSISFRSPAFGWLKFMIPTDQVPAMCAALLEAKEMSEQAKNALPQ